MEMKYALIAAVALATMATPVLAENWHTYSGTDARAYLADVDSLVTVGGITTIRTASVPRTAPAGDLSHSEMIYQFDCPARKWRTAGASEYEPDGTHEDYPEDGAAWEALRPNTMPDFIKQIACDGSRSRSATFPSIRAFIEAGRP
jgi:hypothetical protein